RREWSMKTIKRNKKSCLSNLTILGSFLLFPVVFVGMSALATAKPIDESSFEEGGPEDGRFEDDHHGDRRHVRATVRTPETQDIRGRGIARNFRVGGHTPLLDSDQGTSEFDAYITPPLGIPRGSNGDITAAGRCVYVGSFVGYQPALIVDVSN